ncbi:MAG: response regulator [Gammaproteobacteria bacterium]|nr:response regulator [Gammaproteobacteria bacterium]MCW8982596.1 response regulator [Gammaproteobacteria bacterium]
MACHLTIVDDDEDLAALYRLVAENVGMDISRYDNGADFVHSDLNRAQIVLLDLMLPQMDGVQVLRRLAKSEFKYPIILLSGYDMGALKVAREEATSHELNVISTLTKPVDVEVLEMLLLEACEHNSLK